MTPQLTSPKKPIRVAVVDFFAGCGGASLGFRQARVPGVAVEVIAGIDNDPHCCRTYERMIGVPAHVLDIRDLVEKPERLQALLGSWRLQEYDRIVLVGCSPCQGFAAHRKAVRGLDLRRSLFGVFCELASIIKPDAIFMENVPDMFSKKHWPFYLGGRELLEEAGYFVRSRIYNFAGFGLPQERFRAVMMASRFKFNVPKPVLEHAAYRTVRDAIGALGRLSAGECDPRDPMHIVSKHRPETVNILKRVPADGGNRPVGVGPECLDRARAAHGGYTDVYGRLAWDRPAVTITARCRTPSCGRFAHPDQHRGLSIREAALLQGFPVDFMFEGPFDDKYKQIGNAVPPLVARHFAEHILKGLIARAHVSELIDSEHDVVVPVGPGFAVTINGIKRRRSSVTKEPTTNAQPNSN